MKPQVNVRIVLAVVLLIAFGGGTSSRAQALFEWPVNGPILVNYGGGSDGVDIQATPGSAVVAAGDGTVVYSGNEVRGMGNLLLITHAGGYITAYAKNQQLLVRKGDAVRRGQSVAYAGPQLHFEVRYKNATINPLTVLPERAPPPARPPLQAAPVAPVPGRPVVSAPAIELAAPDAVTMSVQSLLAALGYDVGAADGFMGPKTGRAIVDFQQRSGIPADGRPTEALRIRFAKVTGDIPQNVNFAIRSSTLANFLEASRIPYEATASLTTISSTQLAEQAEAASVQLECRN